MEILDKIDNIINTINNQQAITLHDYAISIDKPETSKYFLKLLADNGDIPSQYTFSQLTDNKNEKLFYLHRAAENGHIISLYKLGKYYYFKAKRLNKEKAKEYLFKCKDYYKAYNKLSEIYLIEKNYSLCYYNAIKSKELNIKDNYLPYKYLGVLYYHGNGVEKNIVLAKEYLQLYLNNYDDIGILNQYGTLFMNHE